MGNESEVDQYKSEDKGSARNDPREIEPTAQPELALQGPHRQFVDTGDFVDREVDREEEEYNSQARPISEELIPSFTESHGVEQRRDEQKKQDGEIRRYLVLHIHVDKMGHRVHRSLTPVIQQQPPQHAHLNEEKSNRAEHPRYAPGCKSNRMSFLGQWVDCRG